MNAARDLLTLLRLRRDWASSDSQTPPPFLESAGDLRNWRRLEAMLRDPARTQVVAERLSAETLAAFVEGALSPEEATRVEAECWADPRAMSEAASAYEALRSSQEVETTLANPTRPEAAEQASPRETPSPRLTNRLLDLTSSLSNESNPPSFADEPASTRSSAPPQVPPPVSSQGPKIEGPQDALVNRLQSRAKQGPWSIAMTTVAVATVVGCLLLLLWATQVGSFWESRSQPELADPNDGSTPDAGEEISDPPDSTPDRDATGSDADDSNLDPSQAPPSPTPTNVDEHKRPSRSFRGPDDASPSPPTEKPDDAPTPNVPSPPRPQKPARSYPALALDWKQIEGLVVARTSLDDEAGDDWHGVRSDALPVDADTYATLPGSWAEAATAEHGTWVLDGDTRMRVVSKEDGNERVANVSVDRGRLAFRDAPAGSSYAIQVGESQWNVEASEPASFAVIHASAAPELLVRQGAIVAEGVAVRRGQQVQWRNASFTRPSAVKESTQWFDRADRERVVRIQAAAQERLLKSRRVFDELARIRRERPGDVELGRAAALWAVSMKPAQQVYASLRSKNPLHRRQTLLWLGSRDPRSREMAEVWKSFVRRTGDARQVRQLAHWCGLAWTRRAPGRQEAQSMVQALTHRDPVVRQMAVFFLEASFGKRAAFDPDATPDTQSRAIRAWQLFVRMRYPGV